MIWARVALFGVVATVQAQAPDPAEVLLTVRDRVAANAEKLAKMSCVQTADRSYFRRENPPGARPSCDQLHADLKRSHPKMYLAATDRLRVRVAIGNGSEFLSWVDPLPFESHRIEEVLVKGPNGTGPLAAFESDIFSTARTSIEYSGERGFGGSRKSIQSPGESGANLEYHFREAEGASHYHVRSGGDWVPTGDSGSFFINPATLALERLIVETSTLPPETSMCEASVVIDYQNDLPRKADWQHLLINADETRSVVSYSSCAADRPVAPPPPAIESKFPANLALSLALDEPIDTDIAAVGDIVSATVTRAVTHSSNIVIPKGAKARGRILNLERRLSPGKYFMLAISFDVVEFDGHAMPLKIVCDQGAAGFHHLDPAVSKRWPELTVVFPDGRNRIVVPRGFESKWLTK
jgi:hypothetical protein